MPAKERTSLGNWLIWVSGTIVAQWSRGSLWGRLRQWREKKFIRRLVSEYPVLADRPTRDLNAVATEVFRSLGIWRVYLTTLAAGVAAAFLTTPVIIAIGRLDVRLPQWGKMGLVMVAAALASSLARRWFITRQIDATVAAAHPSLFCACGYCRVGLPAATSQCPECGAELAATTATAGSAASAGCAFPAPAG